MGIELDERKMPSASPARVISTPNSRIKIWDYPDQ